MSKSKDGGGRKDPPNFNMIGNPERKSGTSEGIVKEGSKAVDIEKIIAERKGNQSKDESYSDLVKRTSQKQSVENNKEEQPKEKQPVSEATKEFLSKRQSRIEKPADSKEIQKDKDLDIEHDID